MSVENYVAAAETLLNLDQPKLKPWTKLVKSDSYLSVFLLILIVFR